MQTPEDGSRCFFVIAAQYAERGFFKVFYRLRFGFWKEASKYTALFLFEMCDAMITSGFGYNGKSSEAFLHHLL
jgi:hypothetical protein